VGSKTFDGVRFVAWTNDHDPPHVHGHYAGMEAIVELMMEERKVRLSSRDDRVKPRNAKRSDVSYILRTAAKYFDELVHLWETA
jgi:hypothetical protein